MVTTLPELQQQITGELTGTTLDYAVIIGDWLAFADLYGGVSFGGRLEATDVAIEHDAHGDGFSVAGTVAWGGFDAVAVAAHFGDDQGDIVVDLTLTVPPDFGLDIPGVDWLKIDQAYIQLASAPGRLLGDPPLVAPVSYAVGAVVTVSSVAVPIRMTLFPGGDVELRGDFEAIAFPSLSQIVAFVGNTDDVHLPASLDGFTVSLDDVSITFNPAAATMSAIGVSVGSSPGAPAWAIVPGVFAIADYRIGLTIADPTVAQRRIGGFITADLLLGGTTIGTAAVHPPSGGWQFEGTADTIPMGALISDLGTRFGVEMPAALAKLTLDRVDIGFDTETHDFHASCACNFEVGDTHVELDASVRLTSQAAAAPSQGAPPAPAVTAPPLYTVVADGALHIDTAVFEVNFTGTPDDEVLSASWHDEEHPLDFAHVATTFGLDLGGVPPDLLPQLVEVSFTYDFTKKILLLTARTEHSATVLVSMPGAGGGARVFAALLGLSVQIGLDDLPLVGPTLARLGDVELDGCQLLVATGPISSAEIATLNTLIAATDPALPGFPAPTAPAKEIAKGVRLALVIAVGGTKRPPISFDFSGTAAPTTPPPGAPAALPAAGATASTPAAASAASANSTPGAWINVQKSFGPVTLNRLGAAYRDSHVWLMLDASFVTAGLTLGLHGLGIGFTLKMPPQVDPRLDGMNLSFSAGPVEISGGFLRVETAAGVEYDGEAMIKVASFTLSAIGAYMTTADGHTSMFVFAILDIPLGGPPIFVITGLAAGFGLNRSLRIPTLDELPTFPLVAAAMAGSTGNNPFAGTEDNAGKALAVLDDYIAPMVGEDWLAIGVRFTSFEIVQSFAMITVQFGVHFEIDLLGLSNLAMPPDVGEDVEPIAFAQLALEATLNPDAGIFGIAAKLTAESFVLSKSCHLTGGFALFMWFKDNPAGDPHGYHAGDFVISLGGYSPFFDVPSFYPVEPRLGLNWSISKYLSIKGGLYFALTSGAVMAGGYLEAVFEAGPLRAWFKVEADFLLGWKPFHYYIRLALSLGFSLHIDLGFVDFTITIELGVGLELWGPTFAGKIHVSLLIVSFTISFGESDPSPKPIPWTEFKSSFLPPAPADAAPAPAVAGDAVAAEDPAPAGLATSPYCSSRFAGGLISDLRKTKATATDPDWIVNPERFELLTNSAIPSHVADTTLPVAVLVTGDGTTDSTTTKTTALSAASRPAIGVGPVAIASDDFSSLHRVTVLKVDPANDTYEHGYDFSAHVTMTAVTTPVPRAAWSVASAIAPSMTQVNDPAGPNIAGAVTGMSLAALHEQPDVLLPIDVSILLLELEQGPTFGWSAAAAPTNDPFGGKGWDDLAGGDLAITAAGPTAARSNIAASLAARGLPVNPHPDVSGVRAGELFTGRPVVRLLGEEMVSG